MNKKAIEWLYQELPELVTKGILPPETAEKIKIHYGPIEKSKGTKTFLMIFGVIGVLLVGLGIILLIAHNWAQLTRVSRLTISIGLLIAAQLIAGMALCFKQESRIWRESSAILHMLMIGAAMALVGQTYHLTEDTDAFLLTWMLLSLPLIYLMRTTSAAIMYIIGVTFWTTNSHLYLEKQLIWVLLLLAMPYYWLLIKLDRYANATVIFSWVLNFCVYVCFASASHNYINDLGMLIYSALFAVNYMVGVICFNADKESWRMPFKLIGLAGSIVLTFMLTFNNIWSHLRLDTHAFSMAESLLVSLLMLLAISSNILTIRRSHRKNLPFSLAPFIVGGAYLLQSLDTSGISATILMNSYMLFLSIGVISTGARNSSVGIVNIGMLMLTALIVARFLDMNFSFVIRGLVFVFLGIAFLMTNWIMVRRKAGEQNEK